MEPSTENEMNEVEATLSEVIAKSLASLKEQYLPVYEVLSGKIEDGFFEKPQSKSAINALADSVLEAILSQEGEDAR